MTPTDQGELERRRGRIMTSKGYVEARQEALYAAERARAVREVRQLVSEITRYTDRVADQIFSLTAAEQAHGPLTEIRNAARQLAIEYGDGS
jgi:hypothetical protein